MRDKVVTHERKEVLEIRGIEITKLPEEIQTWEWDRTRALGLLATCDREGRFNHPTIGKCVIRRVAYESGGQDNLSHEVLFDIYEQAERPRKIELEAKYTIRPAPETQPKP